MALVVNQQNIALSSAEISNKLLEMVFKADGGRHFIRTPRKRRSREGMAELISWTAIAW